MSETTKWLELNLPKYLEHNEPSAVTKEAIKNINKAIDRIEKQQRDHDEKHDREINEHNKAHETFMVKILNELRDNKSPYTKKELDDKFEKEAEKLDKKLKEVAKQKANVWVEIQVLWANRIVFGAVLVALLSLVINKF